MNAWMVVNGLRGFGTFLNQAPKAADAGKRRGVLQGAEILRRVWVEYLAGPASPQRLGSRRGFGGGLMGSIKVKALNGGEEAIVGTEKIYARIHEFGGVIRPRKGQYLRFPIRKTGTTNVGATWVTVREVRMPKRPHRAPAMKLAEPSIVSAMEGAVEESMRKLNASSQLLKDNAFNQLLGQAAAGFTGRRGFA